MRVTSTEEYEDKWECSKSTVPCTISLLNGLRTFFSIKKKTDLNNLQISLYLLKCKKLNVNVTFRTQNFFLNQKAIFSTKLQKENSDVKEKQTKGIWSGILGKEAGS